jgi:hypothetical protein
MSETEQHATLVPPAAQESEVVASTVSSSSDLSALQGMEEVKVRSYADILALHRQLIEEQRAIMREVNAQKTENQRLTEQLIERNAQIQAKLDLLGRIEENQKPPAEPHELPHPQDADKKVKKAFSPFGF